MDYSKYKESRDVSWRILIDNKITELPIKISSICKNANIGLYSYTRGRPILDELRINIDSMSQDGFTSVWNGQYMIFYNDALPPRRNRFTIAHELGHIHLGHVGKYKLINREPSPNDDPIEQAANVFASRLLAPAIVLHDLGLREPHEIMKYCDITYTAATFRAERMSELYRREKEFLIRSGRSCFGLSHLERQVREQFANYVNKILCN